MPTLTWIELCLSTTVLLVLGAYVTSIILHRLRVSSLLSAARASKKAAIQRDVALLAELQQKHSKEIENVDSWLVKHSNAKSSSAPRTPRRSIANESSPTSGSWSALDLAAAVQQGKLTAVGTLLSFARRAFRAHSDYNCITETMLAAAYAQAAEIDALPVARRRALSLCGVPVSLKDTLLYEGVDATNGLAALVGKPATEHALIVRLMMQAGAVPFVKSNIPQTLMSFECVNPVHGRSVNPYNKQYTCGGSSGGEGVLLATQSSALGIGTDIGGSIRIPSHFCGIFGLKPTARRFSSYGFRKSPAAAGQQNILACGGPMGRSVDDLAAVARLWLQPEAVLSVDPSCAPVLPFRDAEYNDQRPMKIGVLSFDDFMAPSPACQRAVAEARAGLQRNGHTLVDFRSRSVSELVHLFYSIISADCGESLFKQVLQEQVEPMMQSMKTQVSIPASLKKIITSLLHLTGSPKAADLLNATGGRSVDELYELVDRRNTLKHQLLCEWKQMGLDAVLCVAGLLPAIPHESFSNVSFAAAPFMLFNVLDLPTGVVPVTRVAADDVWTSSAVDLLESRCHAAYNPALQAGLPVGVQVVALPFQEETCLRAMKATAQAVNFPAAPFA